MKIEPGLKAGWLTVVQLREPSEKHVLCQCVCGVVKLINVRSFIKGDTRSCGCLKRELLRQRKLKHGHGGGRAKRSTEYEIWVGIRKRCFDRNCKAFKDYGGRGITLCSRWDSFSNFLADMGLRPSRLHSIDRINNDGPYSHENCRWATRAEQNRNRSKNATIWSREGRRDSRGRLLPKQA